MRELANALERAAILADGDADRRRAPVARRRRREATAPRGARCAALAELEREAILQALEVVGGNRRSAAELLGIGERTLYDKLKRYGVD